MALLFESSNKREISSLQLLQNKAVKITCCQNNYVSTKDKRLLHNKLCLEMLCTRRKRFLLDLVFKYVNKVDGYRPVMELRGRHKVKMKLTHTTKERVLRNYVAVHLANQIKDSIQTKELREAIKQK